MGPGRHGLTVDSNTHAACVTASSCPVLLVGAPYTARPPSPTPTSHHLTYFLASLIDSPAPPPCLLVLTGTAVPPPSPAPPLARPLPISILACS